MADSTRVASPLMTLKSVRATKLFAVAAPSAASFWASLAPAACGSFAGSFRCGRVTDQGPVRLGQLPSLPVGRSDSGDDASPSAAVSAGSSSRCPENLTS